MYTLSPCAYTLSQYLLEPSFRAIENADEPLRPSSHEMNWFLLLIVLLLGFFVLLLAWFAISSCLGDEIRAHLSGRRQRFVPTTYGMQYARVMGHGGSQAGWEHIEMEDMLDKRVGDVDGQ